jgi:hypothetical protein
VKVTTVTVKKDVVTTVIVELDAYQAGLIASHAQSSMSGVMQDMGKAIRKALEANGNA